MKKQKITLIVICLLLFISCEKQFNRDKWQNDTKSRKAMIKDLTTNVLTNKNKSEIIYLLGEPNKAYFKNSDFVYYLGNESGIISIDSEWFLIFLDSNKKYYRYEIKTD